MGEAVRRQLLPARAVASLGNFQQLIEDGRAMREGRFAGRLEEGAGAGEPDEAGGASPRGTAEGGCPHMGVRAGGGDEGTAFDPSEFGESSFDAGAARSSDGVSGEPSAGEPGSAGFSSTADLLKFLIDRTGYIKLLEEEDTPEAWSRIENLRELVNAAMDSRDRGETLDEFLDHAALISDADDYDERAQISLMSLHSAKGLEFPLVFLTGLEEGLFPHSRTMLVPDDIEEERRLCYVGMTRAMDQLILTRAVYRRRYGTDLPEASVPSRFLEEVPGKLIEELGTERQSGASLRRTGEGARPHTSSASFGFDSSHYSYEDEDQSAAWNRNGRSGAARNSHVSQSRRDPSAGSGQAMGHPGRFYNSIENIAEFFASRGKKFTVSKAPAEEPAGERGFRPGQRVRHPKYGEGTVYQREGEGEDAKITVQFPRFGLKKLVEKYAQLERA
jgi:DNA helicase-2/ATP-dependent DNA helicase PcrA